MPCKSQRKLGWGRGGDQYHTVIWTFKKLPQSFLKPKHRHPLEVQKYISCINPVTDLGLSSAFFSAAQRRLHVQTSSQVLVHQTQHFKLLKHLTARQWTPPRHLLHLIHYQTLSHPLLNDSQETVLGVCFMKYYTVLTMQVSSKFTQSYVTF